MSETPGHERVSPAVQQFIESLGSGVDLTGVELLRRIRRVANLYQSILNQRLRASDLSGPRWHLLVRLLAEEERHGPGGLSPTYLSRCQNVSKNTISALLRGLEDQGLIERTLDPVDRRIFRIRLSAAGRELVQACTPKHFAELNELVGGLSAAERAQLIGLLEKLYLSLVANAGPAEEVPAWHDCQENTVQGERYETQ